MSCSVCRYYFCYICSGPVGACYCDVVSVKYKWLRFLIYIFLATILIMAIPMFLLLATPIAITIFAFKKVNDDYYYTSNKWICIVPGFMYTMYMGCLLNVIAIPIILTVGPCILVIFVVKAILDD